MPDTDKELTEAGRHDMIVGEVLIPAEDRLKQLRGKHE